VIEKLKKIKNVLKLIFFGKSEKNERGGEKGFQTEPYSIKLMPGCIFKFTQSQVGAS
jgi:hypothetical protein